MNEHLDYYGELLPHVLFGDLTRWIISLYRRSRESGNPSNDAAAVLRRILAFLEETYLSDTTEPAVCDLIGASFIENLHQAGEDYHDLREQLGPSLRRQLERSE